MELLRREAEAEAADIRAAAHQAKQKEEDGLRRVRAQRAQLIKSFRAFLERELSELAVAEEALGLRRRGAYAAAATAATADLFTEMPMMATTTMPTIDGAEEDVSPAAEVVAEEEARPRRRMLKANLRDPVDEQAAH